MFEIFNGENAHPFIKENHHLTKAQIKGLLSEMLKPCLLLLTFSGLEIWFLKNIFCLSRNIVVINVNFAATNLIQQHFTRSFAL